MLAFLPSTKNVNVPNKCRFPPPVFLPEVILFSWLVNFFDESSLLICFNSSSLLDASSVRKKSHKLETFFNGKAVVQEMC